MPYAFRWRTNPIPCAYRWITNLIPEGSVDPRFGGDEIRDPRSEIRSPARLLSSSIQKYTRFTDGFPILEGVRSRENRQLREEVVNIRRPMLDQEESGLHSTFH